MGEVKMLNEMDTGILYLCATPIGNLEDITLRVLRILKEVDIIAAEDTRYTIKLLNHYNIKTSLTSYYEHNKAEKGPYLIKKLKEGKNIALVSDAGTPGISDPGSDIVKLCIEEKLKVVPVPGATAMITALIASGLNTEKFMFEGFLTMNKKKRMKHLESIKNDTHTIIFYEAPHKLKATLKDMYNVLGNRKIVLCRELTKKYEQFISLNLEEAVEKYNDEEPRGEYVIVIEGEKIENIESKDREFYLSMSVEEHINMYLEQGFIKKEALKLVAKDRGISKREVYSHNIKK
jgi:16S rRNA (cytidine1402-2'-O)-methyltransferase